MNGFSFGDARRTIYLIFSSFSHEDTPIVGDTLTSGRPLGDLGPRIRGLDWHATVLGLGQISAECCYAIWKASPVVFQKQIRNDVERDREKGVGDRQRNNGYVSQEGQHEEGQCNGGGSSLLERLNGW